MKKITPLFAALLMLIGASSLLAGVTSVTLINQGAGVTCEDANDAIKVTVLATQAALAETYCAD